MMALWLGLLATGGIALAGLDLRLSYRSAIDGRDQPYRLFVPGGAEDSTPRPLVVLLHGTRGDENTFFDDPRYRKPPILEAADRLGVFLVAPYGRGAKEYRGSGEHDVFSVLAEVQRRYPIDRERVYLLGHSMGGTGAAYLALHHPDVFAAAAPLAAAYGFPWLAPNAAHTPFWWIAGSGDKAYFLAGSGQGIERMRLFGAPVRSTTVESGDHFAPVRDLDRVLAWLLSHRLVRPRQYTFIVDTPLHGQAWVTRVDEVLEPGKLARVDVEWRPERIVVRTHNVAKLSMVGAQNAETGIEIDGRVVGAAPTPPRPMTAWRVTPVGYAPGRLSMAGVESTLANWITDAMRAATSADLALFNRVFYRGSAIEAGVVDMVDLLHAIGPNDWSLAVTRLTGREIIEILDDNVPDPAKAYRYAMDGPEADRLLQLSGGHYTFDRNRPPGRRIVWSDLQPDRRYSVAFEGHTAHWETVLLAGRSGKLHYRVEEAPLSTALYGYAKRTGRIVARVEGRVREVKE